MSNELLLNQPGQIDNPLQRLPWVFVSAMLAWAIMLWIFGFIMDKQAMQPIEPKAIDAQLMELPPSSQPIVSEPPRPLPVSQLSPSTSHAKQAETKSSSPAQTVTKAETQTKTETETQTQTEPETETTMPAPVALPDARVSIENKATSDDTQTLIETHTQPTSLSSHLSETPPHLGAAYLNNPKPEYPAWAKRMGMEGIVLLKIMVSREGNALKVELAQSSGYDILDKAATEAVKNWRFVPAQRGETTVDEWVQVPVAFRLNK